jgi:hypothetical protein
MDSETSSGPDPAALDRVRRDLAELGSDATSAPEVPAAVTSRVVTALRAEPAHSIRRPGLRRLHLVGLIVGLGAALAAATVGVTMLARGPATTYPRGPTAELITVSRPTAVIPLSDAELKGLLSRPPDLGPLADPQRRDSCLNGLGYAAGTKVLGAVPIDMDGRPAMVLLLPGATPRAMVAKVVEPNCNAAHTRLLADTAVTRP